MSDTGCPKNIATPPSNGQIYAKVVAKMLDENPKNVAAHQYMVRKSRTYPADYD
jgi:hypothetical protein